MVMMGGDGVEEHDHGDEGNGGGDTHNREEEGDV